MLWADALMAKAVSMKGAQELFELIASTLDDWGFGYCAYQMCIPIPFSNPKMLVFRSQSCVEMHGEGGSRCPGPDVDRALARRPVVWGCGATQDSRPEGSCGRSGWQVGWSKSMPDGMGAWGLLTFARAGGPMDAAERAAQELRLCWLASLAHQEFRRLHFASHAVDLSAREKEILRWAADGKSGEEISEILGISSATVKFHTRNAAAKLGAVNRTATVARAVALGLLA